MPRGLLNNRAGGSYDAGAMQDLADADAFQAQPTLLTGTADAIGPHIGGNFVIKTGSADAITLPAPLAGVDDNLTIAIYSDTLFAHTITCPSAIIANGAALNTVITFKAFRGSGVLLRAFNGTWQVMSSNVTSIV